MGNNGDPSLLSEIGPDGLPREASVVAMTKKIIEEKLLLMKSIIPKSVTLNVSLLNLNLELKLSAGSKNIAFEHLRKKIEVQTEKISAAKAKEEQARKVWVAAAKAVRDEEEVKHKLCEDLSKLVHQSSNSQFKILEELKRRLEALNRGKVSTSILSNSTPTSPSPRPSTPKVQGVENRPKVGEGEGPGEKKSRIHGRTKGIGGALSKWREPSAPGWTGSGFDVDIRG